MAGLILDTRSRAKFDSIRHADIVNFDPSDTYVCVCVCYCVTPIDCIVCVCVCVKEGLLGCLVDAATVGSGLETASAAAALHMMVLLLVLGGQLLVHLTVQVEDDRRAGDAVQHTLQHGLDDALRWGCDQ